MKKYDYLIVGSGLFGEFFAHEATKKGKKCLVIYKRPNIAGNIYTENIDNINVHKYGAHIFHISSKEIWDYINQSESTIISREYSSEWKIGDEPYYPINNNKNNELYKRYKNLAKEQQNIIFGGRLGTYKYMIWIKSRLTLREKN